MKKSILIVEDEAITTMDIKESLIHSGYDVPAIATTGEEAIALSEKIKPDLILMDIVLGTGLDGTQTAKKIVEKQQIPIVFLTAYSDEEHFNNAILSSPYGYITKPYEIRDLQMTIELALHKHKMQLQTIEEINRVKNEFLSNMTHEIRTPLNCIIGFSEMVCEGKVDFDIFQLKEFMRDILSSSRNLMRLLNNVLFFTQLEANIIQIKPEVIQTNQLLEETTRKIESEIVEKKISLRINVNPNLEYICVDSELIGSVLFNYVSNAVKYSNPGGIIEVKIYLQKENLLRIEVHDNGIGIEPEAQKNLFVPFKQLNMGIDKKCPGAGLGRALTRKIVEKLNGEVGFNSTKGEGSIFYASIPWNPSKKTN